MRVRDGAGLAVAGLLPKRLALWDVSRVGTRPVAAPQSPLAPAGTGPGPGGAASAGSVGQAGAATASGLRTALASLLASPSLGPHVGLLVSDLPSGQVIYGRHASTAFARRRRPPRSRRRWRRWTCRPTARFSTTVVGSGSSIVLVGGGDPTLAAGTPPVAGRTRGR